jgi:hypothetical protein
MENLGREVGSEDDVGEIPSRKKTKALTMVLYILG